MNTTSISPVNDFASIAAAFCAWCESGALGDKPEFQMSRWFSRLYAGGLLLVDVPSEEDAPAETLVDTTAGEAAINKLRGYYYREVFDPDPTLNEEPCIGDLGDDLLDIYEDIKRGLSLYELGYPKAAEWEWAFHFRIHWGRHATAGLLALHCLVHAHGTNAHAA
jgi:hypothetical protein